MGGLRQKGQPDYEARPPYEDLSQQEPEPDLEPETDAVYDANVPSLRVRIGLGDIVGAHASLLFTGDPENLDGTQRLQDSAAAAMGGMPYSKGCS